MESLIHHSYLNYINNLFKLQDVEIKNNNFNQLLFKDLNSSISIHQVM